MRRCSFLKATTAMAAHHGSTCPLLKFGHHYVDQEIEYYEAKCRRQQLRWTAKQAAALNMQLVRLPELEVEFLESCSSIAWNLRLTTAPTTKSTHRQCRNLIANGKPSASSTARYSTPMVAPSRQKSLVGM
jgi:hypothetical protein